jgi:hypothetical protein
MLPPVELQVKEGPLNTRKAVGRVEVLEMSPSPPYNDSVCKGASFARFFLGGGLVLQIAFPPGARAFPHSFALGMLLQPVFFSFCEHINLSYLAKSEAKR